MPGPLLRRDKIRVLGVWRCGGFLLRNTTTTTTTKNTRVPFRYELSKPITIEMRNGEVRAVRAHQTSASERGPRVPAALPREITEEWKSGDGARILARHRSAGRRLVSAARRSPAAAARGRPSGNAFFPGSNGVSLWVADTHTHTPRRLRGVDVEGREHVEVLGEVTRRRVRERLEQIVQEELASRAQCRQTNGAAGEHRTDKTHLISESADARGSRPRGRL